MYRKASLGVVSALFLCTGLALAKAPAAAPAGTTGLCKDGSYTSAASKSGACSGHDGVKKWYGAAAPASSAASPASSSDKASSSGKSQSKSAAAAPPVAPESTSSDKGASSGKSKKKIEAAAPAATSVAAPGAATGTCKDGTSTSAASKSGACSGHGGVKEWYAAAGAMAAAAPMSKVAPATAATPSVPAEAPAHTSSYTPPATAAPGGGQGQVWVNKPSKVYHCQNDQWYGKTKDGAYMSEANAIAQGYRADHGRACQ